MCTYIYVYIQHISIYIYLRTHIPKAYVYYRRYITADALWQMDYGACVMANLGSCRMILITCDHGGPKASPQ